MKKPARQNLFLETFKNWTDDKAPMLSAALSYYTIFSIAPLLLVIVGLIGLFVEPVHIQKALNNEITNMLGSGAANTLTMLMKASNKPSTGIISVIIGGITLLLGASGIFVQLKEAFNLIWRVKMKPNVGLRIKVRQQFFSTSMLIVIGFILLVSLLLSTALTVLTTFLGNILPFPSFLLQCIDITLSLGLVTVLFALMYRLLPDVVVPWREIWPSAFITALLYTVGKYALGLYLTYGNVGSAYGAAGSLIVILLWVYYITQLLLFGAEMSKVLVLRHHGKITAKSYAVTQRTDDEVFEKVLEKKITKGIDTVIDTVTKKRG